MKAHTESNKLNLWPNWLKKGENSGVREKNGWSLHIDDGLFKKNPVIDFKNNIYYPSLAKEKKNKKKKRFF